MTRPKISGIAPFFIVHDATAALSFYRDQLGFEITFQEPSGDPFFGIVCRGGAMIMLKDVGVDPLLTTRESLRHVGTLTFTFLILMRCSRRAKTHAAERKTLDCCEAIVTCGAAEDLNGS